MELNLLHNTAEIVDMFVHRDLWRLLEEVESFLKNTELRFAPGTVLRDEFRPCIGCRFTANDARVRGAVRFNRVKEVIVGKAMSLVPLVNIDFMGFFWIRSP